MNSLKEEKVSKIIDQIEERKSELCQLLVKWASINSGSLHLAGLERMRKTLEKAFGRFQGKGEILSLPSVELPDEEGRPIQQTLGQALSFSCRPEAPLQVLLCGHMDTVFPQEHAFQECEFLQGGKRLRGPGVVDMKGGLVVMLAALEAFEQHPLAKNLGWEVLITPDEELGSPGSAGLLEAAAQRNHFGLVFEPTLPDGALVRQRKGSGSFCLVVEGHSAHVGRDFASGRNAIEGLSELILSIQQCNKEMEGAIFNVGYVQGGGPLNVVPDRAIAKVNIRISQAKQEAEVQERMEAILEDFEKKGQCRANWAGGFSRMPKEIHPTLESMFSLLQECGRDLHHNLVWRDTGGCCDGNNLMAAGLPTIDTMGVRGGNLHNDQEFMEIESLTEKAKLTAHFLIQLAGGELLNAPSHLS